MFNTILSFDNGNIFVLKVHNTKKYVVFEYLNIRYWIFNYEYN